MYPKNVTQPMNENQILSGLLEPTNQGYALAKIAGSEIAKTVSQQDKLNWKVLVLSNLYGPGDNFNAESSHLVAAIIAKIYQARQDSLPEVEIWGSGNSRREFTFVDNVADFVVSNISRVSSWPTLMNLGGGVDYSVNEYYRLVSEIIGYEGRFNHALSKPDGMPKKLLDSSLAIKHGWNPKTDIKVGLLETIRYFEREVWN
jgi:GDP-L-fucose synthase